MKRLVNFFKSKLSPGHQSVAMMIPKETIAALRPDDQFVVSFPRSGNTWLRLLLCDLVVQRKHGVEIGDPMQYPRPRVLMPDLHTNAPDHPSQAEYGLTRRVFKSHNLADIEGYRMVYLFRHPVDSLVSYYHLHLREPDSRNAASCGVDEFCRNALQGWCSHVEMALSYHQAAPEQVLLCSYERLLNDGVSELGRAAKFLGIAAESENLRAAIERCAFDRLREREEKNPPTSGEFFFRKGRQGGGREELNQATVDFIQAGGNAWYDRATKALQASLDPQAASSR